MTEGEPEITYEYTVEKRMAAMDALQDNIGKTLSGIVDSWKTAGKGQGTSKWKWDLALEWFD